VLVWFTIRTNAPMPAMVGAAPARPADRLRHLRDARLLTAFGIGFCILFAFIGTFTYVNFVLVAPPLGLDQMSLGFVYFVFLPSIVTTLLAGRAVRAFGASPTLWAALAVAGSGLPLLVLGTLWGVLVGLTLVGVGTFFAQATATGFVGTSAGPDRGSASGLYLAAYFGGGLVGSAVLGAIFDRFGWTACVVGIGVSIAAAALLAFRLHAVGNDLDPARVSAVR
jgi:predicted MFS family arabinose efflux permease